MKKVTKIHKKIKKKNHKNLKKNKHTFIYKFVRFTIIHLPKMTRVISEKNKGDAEINGAGAKKNEHKIYIINLMEEEN